MKLADTDRNNIESQALDAIQKGYETTKVSNPINIDKLLSKHQIEVNLGEFENKKIRAIYRRQKPEIFLSKLETYRNRRFISARELGHHLYNLDILEDIVEEPDVMNFYDPKSYQDMCANHFAASLLMPAYLVKRYWTKFKSTKEIAFFFRVSNALTNYRLMDLNLIENGD